MTTPEDEEIRRRMIEALDRGLAEGGDWDAIRAAIREAMDRVFEWIDEKYPGFPAGVRRMVEQAAADRVFYPMKPTPEDLLALHESIRGAYPGVPAMAVVAVSGEELVRVAERYVRGEGSNVQ